ncbi:hypothetical protein FN846DRAFT_912712 [Sphaerosporella brunnea]|uniref:Uncharacterized protein n=1 Tax=Sphaerosporella brunnea TaxID=1250544 RepID=A0A5J5EHA9_9PEZI|nr:hypothetical protein FN846DRAFT_912712 [Sphaerosporella brunnea]
MLGEECRELSQIAKRRVVVVQSLVQVWKSFHAEKQNMIRNSFISLGYTTYQDNDLSIEGFDNKKSVVGNPFSKLRTDGTEEPLEFPSPRPPPDEPIDLDSAAEDAEVITGDHYGFDSEADLIPFHTIASDDSEVFVSGNDDHQFTAEVEEWDYIPTATQTRNHHHQTVQTYKDLHFEKSDADDSESDSAHGSQRQQGRASGRGGRPVGRCGGGMQRGSGGKGRGGSTERGSGGKGRGGGTERGSGGKG